MLRISNLALAMCLSLASLKNVDAFTSAPSATFLTKSVVSVQQPVTFFNPANSVTSLSMSATEATDPSKSKLVRKPESAVELTLTAPGKATKAAYDRACAEVAKTISIPGFRKGAKIPAAVIENAVASRGGKSTLRTQAIQTLLNQLLEPALKDEHNLEPIGQPSLVTDAEVLAESFVPGEPIEMVVKCDVWPDIEWKTIEGRQKPYIGLEGTYSRKPFDQARFDQAKKDLAERYASLTPAEEGKVLAMGDQCVVNMEGWMAAEDGSKGEKLPDAASGDNVEVILGEGRYMEGLIEGLVGAKVGEKKTVSVSFPEVRYSPTEYYCLSLCFDDFCSR